MIRGIYCLSCMSYHGTLTAESLPYECSCGHTLKKPVRKFEGFMSLVSEHLAFHEDQRVIALLMNPEGEQSVSI